VPYVGYVLDMARTWLARLAAPSLAAVAMGAVDTTGGGGDPADGERRSKKKAKRAQPGSDAAGADDAVTRWPVLLQLWRALLGTLHKAFLYDHERTLLRSRFASPGEGWLTLPNPCARRRLYRPRAV
jgi:hypothetical protein